MQNTETLLCFLNNTIDLSAFCWDESPQPLEGLEERYCFFSQAQPYLTANGARAVLENISPSVLYEIKDTFNVHFFAFLFQGDPILAGPFAAAEWDDIATEKLLMQAGLPESCFSPYKLYYCSLKMLDSGIVAKIITGAIRTLAPKEAPYSYRSLMSAPTQKLSDPHAYNPSDFKKAMRQYDLENRFLSLVEEGQAEAALETWEQLGKIPFTKELVSPSLQAMVANATSLRTLTRKAAERGGVHPVIVDTISVAYAQKMYAARNQEELTRIIPGIIRAFAAAVCEVRKTYYSPAITLAVNYLKLNISREVDMKELADLVGCAPSYLGKLFKKETGMTIAQFLANERCDIAAKLLVRTNMPV